MRKPFNRSLQEHNHGDHRTVRKQEADPQPAWQRRDPPAGHDPQGRKPLPEPLVDRYYVLEDASCHASPEGWARRAIAAYHRHGADRIIGEVNYGGAMVEAVLRTVDAKVPFRAVHASRGKVVRAEPVAALYEQGRVSHVGCFPELEDQLANMTSHGFAGDGSPDRADALVWALAELALQPGRSVKVVSR